MKYSAHIHAEIELTAQVDSEDEEENIKEAVQAYFNDWASKHGVEVRIGPIVTLEEVEIPIQITMPLS